MNLDQQPLYINLNDLIELAVNHEGESIEVDCNINLEVDDVEYKAYSVYISHRDLIFSTDKGIIQYLVDSYRGTNIANLYDWDLE